MDGLNEGIVVDNATTVADTVVDTTEARDTQIQSEIDKGNVRPDFQNLINDFRKTAGLDKKEDPATVITEKPKEEVVVTDEKKDETVVVDPAEKKEGEEGENDLKTPEGEIVKPTRINEVKEWGKGWQRTAETYKPANEFITTRFGGDMEEAELSANLFDKILGTEIDKFNPEEILTELSELSKPRAEKLITYLATNPSVMEIAQTQVIEKIFGKGLSQDELLEDLEGYKLFKQSGGLSSLIGEDGELPAQLQYDAEGNPRPEEELNIFKAFLSEIKESKTERQKEAEAKQAKLKEDQETALNDSIRNYTEDRFTGVTTAIKQLGLEIAPTDTDDVKKAKARDSRMINAYVAVSAQEDPEFGTLYREAIGAIRQGDSITANRMRTKLNAKVASYTSEILDDYIAKNNIKIDKTLGQINTAKDTKKEVNLQGGGTITATSTRVAGETVDQAIARLRKEGKLRSE